MEIGGRISQSVDTVRALHQTILSLRTALEQSRSEIDELKARFGPGDVDGQEVEDRLRSLTVENQILRQKLSGNKAQCKDGGAPKLKKQSKKREQGNGDCDSDTNLYVSTETISSSKVSKSLENLSFVKSSAAKRGKKLSKSRTVTFSNVSEGDKQISTTNSFTLKAFTRRKPEKAKVKAPRQSESGGQLKKARNLQLFREEVIRDGREVCLGQLQIPEGRNIVQEANLKTRKKFKVQRGDFDFKENVEIQPESVSKQLLQEIELQKILYEEQNGRETKLISRPSKTQEHKNPVDELNKTKREVKEEYTTTTKQPKIKETRKHKSTPAEDSIINQLLKTKETRAHQDTADKQSAIKQAEEEDATSQQLLGTCKQKIEQAIEEEPTTSQQLETKEICKQIIEQVEEEEPITTQQLKSKETCKQKIERVKEEDPTTSQRLKTKETREHKNTDADESDKIKKAKEEAPTTSQLKTHTDTEGTEELDGLKQVSHHESEGVTLQQIEKNKSPAESPQTNVSSGTETPSNNGVQKSSELGKVLESVLFGDQKKEEVEEEEPGREVDDVLASGEPQITSEVNLLNTEESSSSTDRKEEKRSEEKEKDDTDTSGTLCSSDDKTVNNVEVSVKIFKGPNTKPIEIDVQTKRIKKGRKQQQAKAEMNDKSQNTSFDNDGGFPPTNVIQNSENIVQNLLQNDTEQEVDDIELIFTTDDTKDTDFKEELVSIEPYASTQLLQCPQAEYDEKADVSDRELEDDVFNDNFDGGESCGFQSQTFDFRREQSQIYNSKSDNSINHEDKSLRSYYSYQDSSFENKSLEKDESFDRFEEKVRIIETDISKVGIQDVDYNMGRRNTCPNPLQYRPIMHREALGRGLNSRKSRPILAHSNVARKECGAQTDISAIPGSSWRSESSLAHKVKIGENFTTLPSKFPHPASKLKLSEKTVEARRVLLSDIGFTSMVPELSRSADHLCPPNVKAPSTTTYGQFLRTPDLYSPGYTSQKFMWTTTATPSEGSHSQSRYSSQYPLSSPPAPMRRCSAPVSPSRRTATLKSTPSRVRFANGSLPELRGDWTTTVDSGESTDSLVEEAEHFLRRSIDCLAPTRDIYFRSDQTKGTMRRASAPEPSRDNVPPPGWQPFLPRVPRDLHLDYWVKVISQEGRVRGGRVRYVGPLMSQVDQFVGVQLSTPDGHSDGTFNNRRYFNWKQEAIGIDNPMNIVVCVVAYTKSNKT